MSAAARFAFIFWVSFDVDWETVFVGTFNTGDIGPRAASIDNFDCGRDAALGVVEADLASAESLEIFAGDSMILGSDTNGDFCCAVFARELSEPRG